MLCWLFAFILFIHAFSFAEEKKTIRVGHFPTITHAQAVIAHGLTREQKGWFEKYLGPGITVEWYVYTAGPSAMEALFAGSIDLAYVGPSPTINAYVKSDGKAIRVICGSCSGGAALVVQPGRIKTAADFLGKKIATPQLGNTQDVAARAWLYSKGFKFNLFGGDVTVIPMENIDQYTLFKQGDLDAVWTVEPWVSRLVIEAEGEIFMEESDLWPSTGGKYVTAHVASHENFLSSHPDLIKKWILAHIELTEWITTNTEKAKELFNHEIKEETFRKLSQEIINRAWKQIELTPVPLQSTLYKYAEWAYEIGFLKKLPQLKNLYDLKILIEVLEELHAGEKE